MNVLDDLEHDEGFVPRTYIDSLGFQTIGFGHKLLKGESFPNGISRAEALELLEKDKAIAVKNCHDHLEPEYSECNEVRQNVLQEMMFNLGLEHLEEFHHLIMDLQDQDYEGAASEMVNSLWHKQVGLRAVRLSILMAKGEDTDGVLQGPTPSPPIHKEKTLSWLAELEQAVERIL